MLGVVMPNVVMLNVLKLNVVAPFKESKVSSHLFKSACENNFIANAPPLPINEKLLEFFCCKNNPSGE
jgi:hypothetical protein